jgi:hypothetical protein
MNAGQVGRGIIFAIRHIFPYRRRLDDRNSTRALIYIDNEHELYISFKYLILLHILSQVVSSRELQEILAARLSTCLLSVLMFCEKNLQFGPLPRALGKIQGLAKSRSCRILTARLSNPEIL